MIHIIDRDRNDLGIRQAAVGSDEPYVVDSRLCEVGIEIECTCAIAVVGERRVRRGVLCGQCRRRKIGIGARHTERQILTFVDRARPNGVEDRRQIGAGDCNRNNLAVSEAAIRGDEGDIVYAGLCKIGTEIETARAGSVVGEDRVGWHIHGRQCRNRTVRIGCRDTKVEIGALGDILGADRRKNWSAVGVVDRNRDQLAISQRAIRSDKENIVNARLGKVRIEREGAGAIPIIRKRGIDRYVFGGECGGGGIGITRRRDEVQRLSLIHTLRTDGGKDRGEIHIIDCDSNDFGIG